MEDSPVERIKRKLNILDVISPYVQLKKAGKSYKGKSPFNVEKTPSFFVHPDKGFFYDFSAGFGGDIFTFIQRIENVSFPEALKILAEKAGVSLTQTSSKEFKKYDQLIAIHEDIAKWYHENLLKNENAINYLKNERGLSVETIKKFFLGFAPNAWEEGYKFLRKKYNDEIIFESGLIVKKEEGKIYDRFRSRIMFPLFNERGKVVAFSGRIFAIEHSAKYMNSPETLLYKKSSLLYPYHLAKSSLSKKGFAILVEGQFDVVLSHQYGYENTLAISGTGLTDQQLKLLKRFTSHIYFALDSDSAGMRATRRSVKMAYNHDFEVSILSLPKGKDPADILKHSKDAWDIIVSEPIEYIDFEIHNILSPEDSFHRRYLIIKEEIFPVLASLGSRMKQEFQLEKLARFLGMSREAVYDDFLIFLKKFKSGKSNEINEKELDTLSFSQGKEKKIWNEEEQKKESLLFLYALHELFQVDFSLFVQRIYKLLHYVFGKLDFQFSSLSQEEKNMILFVVEEEGMSAYKIMRKIFDSLVFLRILSLERELDLVEREINGKLKLEEGDIPKELFRRNQKILEELNYLKNVSYEDYDEKNM